MKKVMPDIIVKKRCSICGDKFEVLEKNLGTPYDDICSDECRRWLMKRKRIRKKA